MHSPKLSLKTLAPALGLLAAAVLVGCGGGGGNALPVAQSPSQTLPNGLVVSMASDRTAVPVGGTVTYTLRVANPTPKAITYRIDFSTNWEPNTDGEFEVVNDATGLGYPRTFTALASSDTKTLPPGKSFTDTVRLSPSQGVFQSRGTYTATVYYGIEGNAVTLPPIVVTAQ